MSIKKKANAAKERGNTLFRRGKYKKALNEYTKAIKLSPNVHNFWSNRSACYIELGRFEEALSDGQKCIKLKPNWARGYERTGMALRKLSRMKEAAKMFEAGTFIDWFPISDPFANTNI